ncbi:Polycystic kidney disease protein 1-like 2 PC1-like 2 protein Polycystin-1L2 Precursor [Larimichthys crocea]|uniref:Polycystic kidney disease protein 1-like 2 PC1-like 2 protein Polycystin-1L2 n=1 Tax=Larimichthys crocea TaxID=215358 RepID=A0A6G0IZU1_LARCR|nr:Polycystic kidney disease protein 1-like 2 PC1-like 2 protein Polycystin-1L2 Precursor [Larimichthys crocea]
MESATFPALTLMVLLLSWVCYADEDTEALSCPDYQEGFDGSCYEFVALQRSFLSAQGWCERGGGHLAFILNDETQQFLQKHLQPGKDWWLGLAPAAPNLTLDSAATEGSLAWLDGSDVSYSNWVNMPDVQAACGHILRHSGFQWEATENCSQELNFICQFEFGRSIACDGQNATLQCGSGQVIEIDDSFYGRKTIHYCRSKLTASPSSTQEECSWIDVMDSVTAHCHGLQACQAPADQSSFGEPCPVLGSYLSVEYHCKHGLHLLMSKLAAVFDNVTITVKWLLHPFEGNLTCTVNAGDGHTIDPYSPAEMESTMMHKFSRPGVFMVGVECTTSDWHVTAQKAITIQEPVREFTVIKCYSRNMSTGGTKCNALHHRPVQIQVMVEAGTNVSYTIQHEGHLVANLSVDRGITPHNMTLSVEVVENLGHGCHNLTLTASNKVTAQKVSTDLELCLLEPVEGLQASVIAEEDGCPNSTDLNISVSLERGAPVELLFTLTGARDSLSETRNMFSGSLQAYTFSNPLEGKHLRCSNAHEVKSVFLPLGDKSNNYTLSVVVTVKNEFEKATTIVSTQVLKSSSSTSVEALQSAVQDTLSQLEQQGLLSGVSLGQIFTSVSDMLNAEAGQDQKDARTKLREQMLTKMTTVLLDSPSNTTQEVQVTARAVAGLTQSPDELSPAAQEEAGSLLVDLSSSLNTISANQSSSDDGEVVQAATPIVEAASNILNVSSSKKVSDFLLTGINNVQSALLTNKKLNGDPAIIDSGQISVYVNRVSPEKIQMQDINVQKNTSSRFSFPTLPAHIVSPGEPVDVRMMSFETNPYSWKEENITGTVGSVSLTRVNGTVIHVENLPEEIEILLPRLDIGQGNSTVLDLANFSTLIIDIPSPDVTLVLKMEPSEDISFMLFLEYKDYPDDKNHVAKTRIPKENSTEEEKYTWVLSPKDRTGDIGVHYLVMKPIVEPGVKSINATVTVISIAAQCKYWKETESSWSEDGCRVGPLTTPLVTQCLCNHLTFFGSSFFVMPNLVDVSRTAELFATFTNNPVVVCFVGAIFTAYLLVVVWARRKDIQDSAKVKITVLEDNDPLAEYRYMLNFNTGHRHGASTSSQVTITLLGTEGESEPHHLTDPEKPVFERGGVDMFLLTTHFSLGDLQSIRLWHDNSGAHPAWIWRLVKKWHFLCNSWLAVDVGECTLDKVFPVATEMDLKRFSNLFFMKTAKDFRDGHIWFSVISRPPCSTFTRVQRVSCCFSLLLCTMLTSIMFWGIPTDPSEQTMDLGHIEFTWQQVMIGIQSSIIMFPINLLIVSIFRNTRPRDKATKTDASKQGKTVRVSPSQTSSPQKELKDITPDTVIKDIKKIAQSLSKAMKSPLPDLELRPGQQADINTLLSLVEDIIRQQNRVAGDFYTDASKRDCSMILSLRAVNLQENSVWGSPEKTSDEVQKKSNNRRYLYRQLRHVEKELGLLGPYRFPNPDSYNRAMEQVQGMKGLLEYHLPSSSLEGDQLDGSSSPEESINGDAAKKRHQGGLPWWFVFVGWILVIATSCVSGYFTMLYGLTYGKDRSISWLISMVVSFFESLFITQPLKVLGFAAFFALVLKKVDQEEYGEPQIDESLRNTNDPDTVHAARRDSTCSFYQPPPPTDIERMRNNMIKEQKVFALMREILTYMGFMWMLLLVAYGQRDPNAYFLTQHIRQSFSREISDSMSIQDVFNWANTTLLSNLFGEYPGFITDGNSKLVGNARLRQVRVRNNSCYVAPSMQQSERDCHAPYSWDLENMGSYGPGWSHFEGDNASLNVHSPWTYQSQGKLRAYPIWGSVTLYRGGGFVVDLGPDLQNSSRTLQYLFDNTWFDVYTQAVFVEFTVYNANVNLFCIVTLMLETTAIGAFQFRSELQSVRLYQSTGGLHIFVMASEAIYFLFIVYYMFVQGKLMKQQKWAYFKIKWNLLELAIIILSWSALSVFIKRTLLGKRDIEYYQNHKDQYASFHETAKADAVLGYLIAFLVLLATIKLWHLLRLNPKLHMITATLQRAWTDISGFLVVMTIMFLAYSIASNLMYGWKLYSYRTLLDAAQTMISLQLGIFNYEEVLNYNPVLGAFLIGSCIVFMTFVVLNLFISVILVAFSQEQIHHKPSEEDEIVDLMLMKLCSLFGLKCKKQGGDCPAEKPVVSSASNNGLSMISPGNIHEG